MLIKIASQGLEVGLEVAHEESNLNVNGLCSAIWGITREDWQGSGRVGTKAPGKEWRENVDVTEYADVGPGPLAGCVKERAAVN
ncbi:unnamed protein product [[Candida] boidinii]|uniref:Unnamed protein product n=1 Tax=Candida boidinii TaxID=5477 RepID=A0A9W6T256_CANBO|nr:unnamed protein product [[Candida] boidinii]GMF02218.1 unnamed protein product [[Candida] boidinii]GMF65441.1 unnamed protein product [[Candida] boidinii]GMF98606.1 unnamed protein product [[Candida] boidinii]